jgi:hypothetical protein
MRRFALAAASRFVYSGAENPVPGEAVQAHNSRRTNRER